jgi:hypothetical protein
MPNNSVMTMSFSHEYIHNLQLISSNMGMGFIDKKFAEEARETVRNPLLHTGEIPGLTMQEKAEWYDDLYALSFKMLLFILSYKGKWFDLSDLWNVVDAP